MPEQHEPDRVNGHALRRVAGIGLAALLTVLAASYAYWRHLFPPPPVTTVLPPQPRLQTHAPQDLAQLRAAQQARLQRYAWNDGSHATAQVPIERAMQLLAQQGRALDSTEPPP